MLDFLFFVKKAYYCEFGFGTSLLLRNLLYPLISSTTLPTRIAAYSFSQWPSRNFLCFMLTF